jgi:coproporphyrinogen III oxidase-like Fe-S oxidoreductase
LGGPTRSQEHALATAKILTDLDPDYAGALTLTLVPGTPMDQAFQKGEFQLISPMQSLQELQWIIRNSKFTHCFFSSMHASNYLSLRGTLPDDKENILHQLDYVLHSADNSLLRPEYMRGL